MTERVISLEELRASNGERGQPRYIAFEGIVYDVGDCPNWSAALHRGQHFAGQDLTQEIDEAPHGPEVFQRPCVHRVGVLVKKSASPSR
jgi:predicted heme/steroid binding protein